LYTTELTFIFTEMLVITGPVRKRFMFDFRILNPAPRLTNYTLAKEVECGGRFGLWRPLEYMETSLIEVETLA
jgi:hypothetical protein